jgi:hypothetical protein
MTTEKQQITIKQEIEMGTTDLNVPTKQQTPLQRLIGTLTALKDEPYTSRANTECLSAVIQLCESLLPEERQMVIDAYNIGHNSTGGTGYRYFNETFKQ